MIKIINLFFIYFLSCWLRPSLWYFKLILVIQIQFSFMMIFYDEEFFDTQIPESFFKILNEKLFFLSQETYGVGKYMSTCFALEISWLTLRILKLFLEPKFYAFKKTEDEKWKQNLLLATWATAILLLVFKWKYVKQNI